MLSEKIRPNMPHITEENFIIMLPWQPASKTLHKLKVPMNVKNQFLDKVECLHQIIKQLSWSGYTTHINKNMLLTS
jgi:hypothetical protein